ncbi:MAG: hypothetical protein RR931_04450 [Mucinivorans sp.]
MKKITILAIILLTACSEPMTKEDALAQLASQPEYNSYFYAPMEIGRTVLSGDDHKKSNEFIKSHYGPLTSQGLVEVELRGKNSWRTVIFVSLSPKGEQMSDPRRADSTHCYVAVCRLKPVAVDSLVAKGDSTLCLYTIEQSELTPFGIHLGFKDKTQYHLQTMLKN